MPDYKLVTWAAEELDEQRDLPFFLAIGLREPHLPWYVPRKYFDMYPKNKLVLPETSKNDLSDIPETGLKLIAARRDHNPIIESRRWLDAVQAYLASITFLDDQVGRLIEALDSSPNADDTIIVLWSDHGFHLGEKKHWGKSTLWEESTRVPLIIVAPGVTKPGTLSARPVDTMSIYPTLADLSGLPIPDHVQGTTLRPLLEDPNAPWKRIALTTYGRGNHAIRTDRWRYIRYRDGTEELYDHFNDPMEWRNLVQAQSTTEISKLKDQFSEWIPVNEAEDAPLKPNSKSVWLKLIHTLLR
jgi:arylsulfatase A-like enzyme